MSTLRRLTCSCCGSDAGRFQQHYNRDTGFGICARCIAWIRGRGTPEPEIARLYGAEGVNFAPAPRTLASDIAEDR